MDEEELLEILENGVPMLWKYQIDKEALNASPKALKEFINIYIYYYKELEPQIPDAKLKACKVFEDTKKNRLKRNYAFSLLNVMVANVIIHYANVTFEITMYGVIMILRNAT
eukprot:6880523-Ditylum_brightwellii.AAC.1